MSYILAAACKYVHPLDGTITIIVGTRHYDSIMCSQIDAIDTYVWEAISENEIQGFIDSDGNFLTREEAWIVAENNNQIKI